MDSPLPPEIAADLEDEHHKHVGLQAAQLGAAARMSDDIADGAAAAAEPRAFCEKRRTRFYEGPRRQFSIHRHHPFPG